MLKFYILLVLIQVLFGLNFVFSKYSLGYFPPLLFSFLRFFISFLVLGFFIPLKAYKRVSKSLIRDAFFLAFIGFFLGQGAIIIGLKKTLSTNVSFLTSTIPLCVYLMSWALRKVEMSLSKVVGLILGVLGVLQFKGLFSSLELSFTSGDLYVLVGVLSTSLYIILTKNFFTKYDVKLGTMITFIFGALFLLCFSISVENLYTYQLTSSANAWLGLFYAAIGATLIPYFLSGVVVKRINPHIMALYVFLQPIFTFIGAMIVFQEQINLQQVTSVFLILLGIYLVELGPKKTA